MYFQEQIIEPKKKKNNTFVIISLVIISIAAGILVSNLLEIDLLNLVSNKQENPTSPINPVTDSNLTKDEASQKVVEAIKKIVIVDSVEAPTIANIKNVSLLKDKNPLFYKDAVDGDYLIIYKNKAIIYRESSNKIVSMIPLESE